MSPMHCIIKTHRQKAWDDGVAPSVTSQSVSYLQAYTFKITVYIILLVSPHIESSVNFILHAFHTSHTLIDRSVSCHLI